ncbi:Erythromycin esterase homolog [Dyadobacter koreensis]|uniref:Erythromycin esterase homolog n=1 Tax=Dyadobacter koreensis TaxID=408657 RepID=A0A1H7AZ26_9BACT|nr:erythromycin esterase family protein [Dyadobacter koreensis]SEJ69854.1 Erythromycin esterase homolog [Dyadobacter koreensis]
MTEKIYYILPKVISKPHQFAVIAILTARTGFFTFLIVLASLTRVDAQNFSFELSGAKNIPRYWTLKNKGFYTSLSNEFAYDGKRSFKAVSTESSSSIAIYSTIDGNSIPPGQITIEAFVKYENVEGIPDVFCRLDGEDELLGYTSTKNESVSGQKSWYRISCSLDTKGSFRKLVAGFTFRGKGTVFVDNFAISINGQKLPDATIGVNDADCSSTIHQAILSSGKYDTIDDMQYSSLLRGRRLVAIGEAVHGSAEIYRAKIKLTKMLIQRNGAINLYVELDHMDASRINSYVCNLKTEDPKQVLAGLTNQFLNNQFFFEFIKWLKDYNAISGGRISFIGIDFQDSTHNLERLSQLWGDKNRAQMDSALLLIEKLSSGDLQTQAVAAQLFKLLKELIQTIPDVEKRQESHYICRLLEQKIAFVKSRDRLSELISRDSSMAVNVLTELMRDTAATSVLWAHNMHVSKMQPYMGSRLAKFLLEDYHSLAISFDGGEFTTLNAQDASFRLTQAFDAGPGAIEYCLASYGYDILVNTEKLTGRYDMRVTGAQDLGRQFIYSINLRDIFDFFYLCGKSSPLVYPHN